MPRTKYTVRRLMERCQKGTIKRPFKIKTTLPEEKQVNIKKKNGNVVKTNVRRKTTFQ